MDLSTITVAQFQAQFPTDFPSVMTQQITNAFNQAQMVFNQGLFQNNNDITLAYLFLTAHYVCVDAKLAAQGLNSSGAFLVSSRSVGSVSESYTIPEIYTKNANLAPFTTTGYGMKYLSFLLPNLVGNVVSVYSYGNP